MKTINLSWRTERMPGECLIEVIHTEASERSSARAQAQMPLMAPKRD